MVVRGIVALAALLGVMAPCMAQAHPHEWIDVRTQPVIMNGQMTALKQSWLFDIYYTALSLPDFDANRNGKLDADELLLLGKDNLNNLRDYGYFTVLTQGKKVSGFNRVSDISSRLEGGRVALEFTLHLETPLSMKAGPVEYRVYDPSYYVAMLHQKEAPVHVDAPGCAYALKRPEPDAVWIGLAKGLDKNASAPDNLGANFAETVTITCH